MPEEFKRTVRLVRRDKVMTDDRGRTVWNVPIEDTELELVSTTMLKQIIESDDEHAKKRIAEAASDKDGVLAHNPADNQFQIIEDDDLEAALNSAASAGDMEVQIASEDAPEFDDSDDSSEELSLVSTQMLRQLLEIEEDEEDSEPRDSGFNPYDHS